MTTLNMTTPELDDIDEDDELEPADAQTLHHGVVDDPALEADEGIEQGDDPQEVDVEDHTTEEDA